MAIFDTSIIIDYLRGKKDANETIRKYSTDGEASITSITGYELVKGLRGLKEEALVELLFNTVKIYSVDLKAARAAGDINKRLQTVGAQLSDGDTLIAGVAIANDQILVTRDLDFKRLGSENVVIV